MNHIQPFFEFWRKAHCPACKAENWVYDSHSQKNYARMPYGCECHACQNVFFLGDKEEFDIRYHEEITEHELNLKEYVDFDKGIPKP